MTFRCQMHNRVRFVLGEQSCNQWLVVNVAMNKQMSRIICHALQITQVTGICELVQIYHRRAFGHYPVEHKICADKPGTTRDKNHFARTIPP